MTSLLGRNRGGASAVTLGYTAAMQDSPIIGRVGLTEADLRRPIVEMSLWTRLRWGYVALWIAFGSVLVQGQGPVTDWLPQMIAMGVFAGFLFYRPWLAARRSLAALVRAGDSEVIYRFDEDGVTIRASGSTTTFAYRTLTKVKEGTTALLLYSDPAVASIIPKRAFAPADLERVRALVAPHAKPEPLRAFPWKGVLIWLGLVFVAMVVWQLMNAHPPR
jgi:hypothetical protein